MAIFTHTSTFTPSQETVKTWLTRPGALTRATPHWSGSVKKEGDPQDLGSQAHLASALPFTSGLLTLPWTAEHVAAGEDTFTDQQAKGPFSSWQHTHDFFETPGRTVMRDTVTYELFPGEKLGTSAQEAEGKAKQQGFKLLGTGRKGAEKIGDALVNKHLTRVFDARERRIAADLEFQERYAHDPITVVIAGASGMVGQQVSALLTGGGHTVRTLVRRAPQAENEFRWDPAAGEIDTEAFDGAQAVIHLGGASINQRFTEQNKKAILESRIQSTTLLANTLADLARKDGGAGQVPHTFICASAVGFYGADRGTEVLTEDTPAGSGFLAEVCQQWEAATEPAREAGLRTVNIRTGLVQSALGGMLKVQLPLFLTGTGGYVGSGEQMQSWVSLDDIAGIYVHALFTDSLQGPVNAVAPTPVTAKKLAKTVGAALKRPAVLPIPPAAPALLLKKEGVQELALASQNASADKLVKSGYVFFEPALRQALEHELVR